MVEKATELGELDCVGFIGCTVWESFIRLALSSLPDRTREGPVGSAISTTIYSPYNYIVILCETPPKIWLTLVVGLFPHRFSLTFFLFLIIGFALRTKSGVAAVTWALLTQYSATPASLAVIRGNVTESLSLQASYLLVLNINQLLVSEVLVRSFDCILQYSCYVVFKMARIFRVNRGGI